MQFESINNSKSLLGIKFQPRFHSQLSILYINLFQFVSFFFSIYLSIYLSVYIFLDYSVFLFIYLSS